MTDYLDALNKGDSIGEAERATGDLAKWPVTPALRRHYVDNSNLRLDVGRFTRELLREQEADHRPLRWPADRPLAAECRRNARVRSVRHAQPRRRFRPRSCSTSPTSCGTRPKTTISFPAASCPWDWGRQNTYVDTTAALRNAFIKNPHLKVLVCAGYYDLATPVLHRAVHAQPHGHPSRDAEEHQLAVLRSRAHDVHREIEQCQVETRYG